MNFIDAVYIMKLYEIKIFSSLMEKKLLFLFGFVKNGLFIYFYIYRYTTSLKLEKFITQKVFGRLG